MSRFAWLALLGPLACFSEGGVDSDGDSSQGESTPSTTMTTASTSTAASSESTATDPDSGEVTGPISTVTSSTDATETDPGTTDTGDACPGGFLEIPPVPVGWAAVFTLSPDGQGGEDPPECSPSLVDAGVVVAEPVVLPCACECDPECYLNGDLEPGCSVNEDIFGAVDEACVESPMGAVYVSVEPDLGAIGGCDVPSAVPVVDGVRRRVCEHTDGTPCLPAPPGFLAPCVRHDGDVACPAGPYRTRVRTIEAIDITCDPCDPCVDAAISACMTSTITLYSEAGCEGDASEARDGCSTASGVSFFVDLELDCPTSSPSPGLPVGERTYCCVP